MSDVQSLEQADLDRIGDDLLRAYRVCRQAAMDAMGRGGGTHAAGSVAALADCADVSLMLANLLLRTSTHTLNAAELARQVAAACAEQIQSEEHESPPLRTAYAMCVRVEHDCLRLLGEEPPDDFDDQDASIDSSFPASDPPSRPTE